MFVYILQVFRNKKQMKVNKPKKKKKLPKRWRKTILRQEHMKHMYASSDYINNAKN